MLNVNQQLTFPQKPTDNVLEMFQNTFSTHSSFKHFPINLCQIFVSSFFKQLCILPIFLFSFLNNVDQMLQERFFVTKPFPNQMLTLRLCYLGNNLTAALFTEKIYKKYAELNYVPRISE